MKVKQVGDGGWEQVLKCRSYIDIQHDIYIYICIIQYPICIYIYSYVYLCIVIIYIYYNNIYIHERSTFTVRMYYLEHACIIIWFWHMIDLSTKFIYCHSGQREVSLGVTINKIYE